MSGPSIHFTLPDPSLFKFPPHNLPAALPPPSDEATWKSPFPIDFDVYNRALDVKVPITIATIYVITVLGINAYNRRQGNKPWAISKTRAFKLFVVLHNVFLAVYSGVTFYAMCRAINATWPGLDNSAGLAGVADSLCKINGPRGLGDAVHYNATSNVWQTKNALIKLLPEGTPDSTDVGRLWNEGLAFWGWFFYLSKFYEVVDTMIIVAKGKRSATLQTYHHAGAMLCMWAGIRYMSPPIWMFVFINSFIHTLMYTYFTLSAVNIRVPNALKRTLTSMQITQFVFGASYAAIHLFVKYDIPIATAYSIFHPISSAVAKASSTASSVVSAETYGAILRRILLRAAGDEGVAENVRDSQGNIIMEKAQEAIQKYHEETRYRTDYATINCLDTTGQSFAVWLNILYLFPLTILFVRFFVRAYVFRSGSNKSKSKRQSISRATKDAAHGTNREVEHAGKVVEKKLSHLPEDLAAAEKRIEKKLGHLPEDLKTAEKKLQDKLGHLPEEVKKDLQALKDGRLPRSNRPVSDRVESFERKMTPTKKDAKQIKEEAADNLDELKQRVKKETSDKNESAKDSAPESTDAPATPSKKQKKKKNKKNKNKQATNGADNVDDHTDAADSGSEHEHTEPESFADALKENLKKEGETQDLKSETDKA
ncbi:hypothetical protein KCU62_g2517, partial [Aureobasidium sp. EXF-3399]